MIQVTISEDRITAAGHAGADVRGKDLVCAGVSVLTQAVLYPYKMTLLSNKACRGHSVQ